MTRAPLARHGYDRQSLCLRMTSHSTALLTNNSDWLNPTSRDGIASDSFSVFTRVFVCTEIHLRVCLCGSGDISISSVFQYRGGIMAPTSLLLTFCSTGTHTHICRRAYSHTHTRARTSFPILISHSTSHRGLTDDSTRQAGGTKEVQSEAFWDGRGSKGIPLYLIGRRAQREEDRVHVPLLGGCGQLDLNTSGPDAEAAMQGCVMTSSIRRR